MLTIQYLQTSTMASAPQIIQPFSFITYLPKFISVISSALLSSESEALEAVYKTIVTFWEVKDGDYKELEREFPYAFLEASPHKSEEIEDFTFFLLTRS